MKIETTTLRDLTEEDLDTLLQWRNDPQTNRYLSNRVKTKEESVTWFKWIKSDPKNFLKGILYDGALIGYCIVEDIDDLNRKCEVGIIIGKTQHWGKGIGKSTVKEMLRYCFTDLKLHRVLAVIAHGNHRSEELFKKMGFTYEGTLREATKIAGQFTDLLCYSMLEDEYKECT